MTFFSFSSNQIWFRQSLVFILCSLFCLLLLAGPVLSQGFIPAPASDGAPAAVPQPGTGAAPAQSGSGDVMFHMTTMFLMVFVIFYFLILRPQQAKLKAHKELIGGLKKGDSVVTSGGIIGRVAGIDPGVLLVEIAQNVKIKVEESHIVRRIEKENSEKAAA